MSDALALHCVIMKGTVVLSLTLPTRPTNIGSQSLTALDASVIFNKGCIEVTGASVPRLDYCNAILAGTADIVIKRLQSVQNTAACLVSGTIFRDHYRYSTQPPNSFQEHNLAVFTYINSASR